MFFHFSELLDPKKEVKTHEEVEFTVTQVTLLINSWTLVLFIKNVCFFYIELTELINTHYIHSVLVEDFVSGRACFMNQYHYEV